MHARPPKSDCKAARTPPPIPALIQLQVAMPVAVPRAELIIGTETDSDTAIHPRRATHRAEGGRWPSRYPPTAGLLLFQGPPRGLQGTLDRRPGAWNGTFWAGPVSCARRVPKSAHRHKMMLRRQLRSDSGGRRRVAAGPRATRGHRRRCEMRRRLAQGGPSRMAPRRLAIRDAGFATRPRRRAN
jgi:hypothetical protein